MKRIRFGEQGREKPGAILNDGAFFDEYKEVTIKENLVVFGLLTVK
jgi:hypothetical protein